MMGRDQAPTGKDTSIWMDTAPTTKYPRLLKDWETDVVVIGGGIAGLMTAYFLQKTGLQITLVEADRIATGTSGFTTAKVTSAHGIIYRYLIDHFGTDGAQIYASANQEALMTITGLILEHNIKCDFAITPAYTYVTDNKASALIREEVSAAHTLGLPVSLTRDVPLPYKVAAAIRFDRQGKFHPRKFLLHIAAVLHKNGAHIFERTAVTNIEEGDPCRITTQRGTITAGKILIATNMPIYDPSGFFSRMVSRQSFTMAATIDGPLPRGIFYGPKNDDFHSLRTQKLTKGREILILGGEVHHSGERFDAPGQFRLLEKWARQYFPLRTVEYRWTTSDSESYDRVPMIGKISPDSKDVFVATGFTGWGMTHGTVAGLILADEMTGCHHPWSKLYSPQRFPTFPAVAAPKIGAKGSKAKHLAEPGKYEPIFADLKPGQGLVRNINGKLVAANRDQQGHLNAVSAICTHMGCIVGWNGKEQTWDCPCHGSRYDYLGKVIHGPAPKDLSSDI